MGTVRAAILACLAVGWVRSLAQAPVSQGDTILQETFDKAPANWSPALEDGALRVDTGLTILPVMQVADATVHYRVKVAGEGLVEFLFRYGLDTDDYYIFRIDTRVAGGNPPGFLKRSHQGDPWVLAGERLGRTPAADRWLDVVVELNGGTFRGLVDGRVVTTLTDDEFVSGGFGFRSQVSHGWVDDLTVRVPRGTLHDAGAVPCR